MGRRTPPADRRTPPGRPPTTEAAATRDDLADEAERGPLRRCIVTRERQPKEALIRFVLGPDRALVPDLAARLPGRGIWLSARRDVLETARARGAFAKAARGPVIVPPDLAGLLQTGLVRRITDLLGLARRAGQAVCGFAKAREWLLAGHAGLVVQAADGSAPERSRLLGGRTGVLVLSPLPAAALGAVFGRDHVVHVAVAPGRLAEMLRVETGRLAGLAGRVTDGIAGSGGPEQRDDRQTGGGKPVVGANGRTGR
ncbi:MAG: RNA-binding protein [Acidisphaera sp.]|nr:RNA-binding protein [Acidisphaera sp.]